MGNNHSSNLSIPSGLFGLPLSSREKKLSCSTEGKLYTLFLCVYHFNLLNLSLKKTNKKTPKNICGCSLSHEQGRFQDFWNGVSQGSSRAQQRFCKGIWCRNWLDMTYRLICGSGSCYRTRTKWLLCDNVMIIISTAKVWASAPGVM